VDLKTGTKVTYVWCKTTILQFFGGLIAEQKGESALWVISLGRVAFWIVFGHVMWLFSQTDKAVSPEELSVFYSLLGYQGVKLGKELVTESVATWKGTYPV
jgi:hypothetical protein